MTLQNLPIDLHLVYALGIGLILVCLWIPLADVSVISLALLVLLPQGMIWTRVCDYGECRKDALAYLYTNQAVVAFVACIYLGIYFVLRA